MKIGKTSLLLPPQTGGDVAQSVEQRTENPCVGGSIPPLATMSPDLLVITLTEASQRPPLNKHIRLIDFKQFYWKKAELLDFCRIYHLPSQGGKIEIAARIEQFLSTGEITIPLRSHPPKEKYDSEKAPLTRITKVSRYKSDPVTRAFFIKEIGPHFRFNAGVLTWIKQKQANNENLTYNELS